MTIQKHSKMDCLLSLQVRNLCLQKSVYITTALIHSLLCHTSPLAFQPKIVSNSLRKATISVFTFN